MKTGSDNIQCNGFVGQLDHFSPKSHIMSYRHLLILIGVILVVLGLIERGWLLVAVWLGCDFLVLGVAHGRGSHRVFGKRADGTLPLWSWLVFLPLLIYTTFVWHIIRLFSREPVNDHLNRATHDRRNRATAKCPKSGFGRPLKQGFYTSFPG